MNAPKPSAPTASEPRRAEPFYTPSQYNTTSVPVIPPVPSIPSYDLEPLESDAILTFSQTVEQVEAQGGRDISRHPAVNELYDKANNLRPKLALSLDDAGRKEGEFLSFNCEIPCLLKNIWKKCYRICITSYLKPSNYMMSC